MERASEEILAKVKKLMALGESPSEAEAASALEKARSLLARYGLSIEDVDASETSVIEDIILEKKRLRVWEAHLIYVITTATFTQALHVERSGIGQVLLIGREVNTRSAANLFVYLHLVALKLGREHSGKVAHLDSFRLGVVQRIGERLTAMNSGDSDREEGTSPSDRQLTVRMDRTAAKENSAYIANKYGKTKTKRTGRRVDADSFSKGRAAGERVSLSRQIN